MDGNGDVLYRWGMATETHDGARPAATVAVSLPWRAGPAFRHTVRAVLHAPWSAWGWRSTCHVVVGGPIGMVTFAGVVSLSILSVGLAVTVVLAAVMFLALVNCLGVFTSWQRSRFATFLDVHIEPMAQRHDGSVFRRALAEARSARTWRQLAYHLLAGLLGPAGALAVVAAWSLGLVLTVASPLGGSWPAVAPGSWRGGAARAGLTLAGLLFLFAAPWLARALAGADTAVARTLLGPSRHEELARRVASLAASRTEVVDAADAERRRIERDLHDGTQQRLTSLAMNLGIAQATLSDLSPSAREALAQAHDEAKQTLAELRGFVRGMHPAVLDDRGLDAALSGIVARSPIPVRLRVTVADRAAPAVEAIAYFVVSEALTNAAKHAGAARVEVTVERIFDRLWVTVRDDGRGGADPAGGSGLRGLAQRVGSVDGTLKVTSPVGGPTTIVAELPCEL
jgi:signal transduction histidine kinase